MRTHSRWSRLLGFRNLGDGDSVLYASSSGFVLSGRPANAGIATTKSRRLPIEDADQINKEDRQTDPSTNKGAKGAKWAGSEAAAARTTGKKLMRMSKSNDVLDGNRRDMDESIRRDLDESDDE